MLKKYHGSAATGENQFERRVQGLAAVNTLAATLRKKASAIRAGTAQAESTPIGRIDADGLDRLAGAVLWTWHNRRRWAKLRSAPAGRRARYLRKTLRSVYRKAGFDPEVEGRCITREDLDHTALDLVESHGVPASICTAYANTLSADGPDSVQVTHGPVERRVTFRLGWTEPPQPALDAEPKPWLNDSRHVQVLITDNNGTILYDRVLRREGVPQEPAGSSAQLEDGTGDPATERKTEKTND